MENYLKKIYLDTTSPTYLAGINALYYQSKKKFPNIKIANIKNFLEKQKVYSLHKPYSKYQPGKITASGLDTDWMVDLADLQLLKQYNENYSFILVCTDVLSKYAWGIPLKNKKSESVIEAFQKILDSGRKPWYLYSDKGAEFVNAKFLQYLKKKFIISIQMQNPDSKAANAERLIKTIKSRIYKHFTLNNTLNWTKILPKIVSAINRSVSTVHGLRPIDIKEKNSQTLYKKQFRNKSIKRSSQKKKPRYQIGDRVRIYIGRRTFRKGYLPTRTDEIFIIDKILFRDPIVYKLNDLLGQEITGIFYTSELSRVQNGQE